MSPGLIELAASLPALFNSRELFQPYAAHWLPQFEDAAGLDLADAFAGDAEQPGHFVQRLRLTIAEAVAQFDHLAFALGE